ncbi:MAG: sulfatase-like hydrolase/transferase [Myxococcales bacterium]|nr:sulfatase-like hydrolase/transferase [Myxococcales bacterium]
MSVGMFAEKERRAELSSFSGHVSFLRFASLWHFLLLMVLLFAFLPAWKAQSLELWVYVVAYGIFVQGLLFMLGLVGVWLPWGLGRRLYYFAQGLLLILLLLDLFLFSSLRIHLYDPMIMVLIRHPNGFQDAGIRPFHFVFVGSMFLLVFFSQWLLVRAWKRWWCPTLPLQRRALWWGVTLGFFALGGTGYTWTPKRHLDLLSFRIPGFQAMNPRLALHAGQPLRRKKLKERVAALRYPLKTLGKVDQKKLNRPHILLIASESVRADMLNPQDMPYMSKFLQKHPHLSSTQHYSSGHQTWEGMFGLLYSMQGHHRASFRGQPHAPYNLKILKKLGYKLLAFSASSFKEDAYKPMIKIFDHHYDIRIFKGSFDSYHSAMVRSDLRITEMAIKAIEEERKLPPEKQKPLFIVLFYVSTHYPYESQPKDRVFQPFLADNFNRVMIHKGYRLGLWNRFRNACRFVDRQIHRVLEAARQEIAQQKLMWAFVGDHGEEFWDAGEFGHASRRLVSSRAQTAFALYAPMLKKSQRLSLTQHADIFPTFFDLMGLDFPAKYYSDGESMLKLKPSRFVQVNGYGFPDLPGFALVTPRFKIFARRTLGFEFEVNAVLDREDRPVQWKRAEIEPVIRQWMKEVDHFYPGFRLWESNNVLYNFLPSFPFAPTRGPIRTASRPSLKPWDRLGDKEAYISRKPFPFQTAVGLRLGSYIDFVGYTLRSPEVRLGDDMLIEFVFRCHKKIPPGMKIFFHGKRQNPPYLVGADHDPIFNTYPIQKWKVGEYIRDIVKIPTTNEWTPGPGRMWVGLYQKKGNKRFPIFDIKAKKKLNKKHTDVISFWFVP